MRVPRSLVRVLGLVVVVVLASQRLSTTNAWEWSDWVVLSVGSSWKGRRHPDTTTTKNTVWSIQEISAWRVRDIQRRLSRHHGYSATELGRILDKKELIQTLAFAEEKVRLSNEAHAKRVVLQQTIVAAIVTLLLIFGWPLFQHVWEVAMINLVVYTDRKRYEASRCWELHCARGMIGVVLMGILDILQVWLTASILLSWVTTSRYFFPVPQISVRPAQFMGGEMASSSVANYGINIGSLLVTWGLRFVHRRLQEWTGRALAAANRQTRRKNRRRQPPPPDPSETNHTDPRNGDGDRATRKAARRAAKLVAAATTRRRPTATTTAHGSAPLVDRRRAHHEFMNELDQHTPNASSKVYVNDDEATAWESSDLTSTLEELD